MSLMIFPLLLLLLIVVAQIFLALWTYSDAKSKNLNAFMWTLIVLFVPNLLGLLLYFLVGRNQPSVICSFCNSKVPQNSKYCLNCGNEILNANLNEKKSNKSFLIAFIISMAIILFIGIMLAVNIFSGNSNNIGSSHIGNYSIGCIESNIGNTWKVSFKESNEIFRKSITLKDNVPKSLEIDSSYSDGYSYLYLYRDGKSIDFFNLPSKGEGLTIDLTKYGDGKITFELTNDEVSNLKFTGNFTD